MDFLKEIDKQSTKNNAYKVLKQYRRFSRIAGEEYTPKLTPTYTL